MKLIKTKIFLPIVLILHSDAKLGLWQKKNKMINDIVIFIERNKERDDKVPSA